MTNVIITNDKEDYLYGTQLHLIEGVSRQTSIVTEAILSDNVQKKIACYREREINVAFTDKEGTIITGEIIDDPQQTCDYESLTFDIRETVRAEVRRLVEQEYLYYDEKTGKNLPQNLPLKNELLVCLNKEYLADKFGKEINVFRVLEDAVRFIEKSKFRSEFFKQEINVVYGNRTSRLWNDTETRKKYIGEIILTCKDAPKRVKNAREKMERYIIKRFS